MHLRRFSGTLLAVLMCISAARSQPVAGPLEYRGWSTQNGDQDYLAQLVPRAAAAGMNHLQLCHGVVAPHGVDQLLAGPDAAAIQERVNLVCDLAHRHNIKVDMWVNELSDAPKQFQEGGRVKLTPRFWKWLEAKYDRVFSLVPNVDGIVLAIGETRYPLLMDSVVVSKDGPSERLAKLAEVFARICERHDKALYFRSDAHDYEELAVVIAGITRAAERSAVVKKRLTVMSKVGPSDFSPYLPYNPALGGVGGLRQIMELDLGAEFSGQNQLLFDETDFIHRVLDNGRRAGIVGAVARIERWRNTAIGTPNEVNVYAYGRLLQDSRPTAAQLRGEWCKQRYGRAAGPFVASMLARSFDINNSIFFPLEEWVANHSRVPSWSYVEDIQAGWNLSIFHHSPRYDRSRDEFLHPTPELLFKLAEEKELGRRLNAAARGDLLQTRVVLPATEYAQLEGYLDRNDLCLDVYDHHHQALFGAWRYRDLSAGKTSSTSPELMMLRYDILNHLAHLSELADAVEALYTPDFVCARPADIRGVIADVEKRLGFEEQAKLRTLRFMATSPEGADAWQADLRARFLDLLNLRDQVKRNYPNPFNAKVVATTDEGSWALKQITINTTPTRRMDVLVGMPKGIKSPRPAVVCIGGHGSTQWSPYDMNPRSLYTGFADALTREGYVTISPLVSQHVVYEEGRTLMGERLWDCMRCVDYLETLKEVDKTRMGCGGLSLGGEMVMWLAAMDTRMKASVSCGFLCLMDQLEHHCLCWKFPGEREIVDFPDIYCLVAPRAMQCQNGLRELPNGFYVPIARYAMQEEIRPAYRVYGVPDQVELHPHDGAHVIDTPALVEYMKAHL